MLSGWQRAEVIEHDPDMALTVLGERVRDALARLPAPVPVTVPTS